MKNILLNIVQRVLNVIFIIVFRIKYSLKILPSTFKIEVKRESNKYKKKLAFFDNFISKEETKRKWVNKPQWSRGLSTQDVIRTNWKNTKWKNNHLIIITKYKPTYFKDWNGEHLFDFTTAHLETNYLHSKYPTPDADPEYVPFLQKYGLFEAKVKFDMKPGGFPAFWLLSEGKIIDEKETILPEIDIYEYLHNTKNGKYKYQCSQFTYHWGKSYNHKEHHHIATNIGRINLGNKFYIFSLKWTPKKLIWYINDCPIKIQLTNLPDRQVYPIINGSITLEDAKKEKGWKTRDIWDWVHIYKN